MTFAAMKIVCKLGASFPVWVYGVLVCANKILVCGCALRKGECGWVVMFVGLGIGIPRIALGLGLL